MRSSMDMDNQFEGLNRSEFPQQEDLLYLNHAAVSPWPKRTADAVISFAEENIRFGAQNYPQWMARETTLRGQLKSLINAPTADDIALLKNTSEALSVVASGIPWCSGENIVGTDQEFPSNRIVWQVQEKHEVEYRPINITDTDDPENALISACNDKTRLLAISSVQYGTGLRLNLEKLGKFCQDAGIFFCVDAIQTIGALNFDVQAIHADFVMADAHKWMLGPEGIALFYCRSELRDQLELHQYGWHMVEDYSNYDATEWQIASSARRFECGSPNMLGIHAFSASLSLLTEIGIEKIERNILNNTSYLIDNLSDIDGLEFITPTLERLRSGIVTFKMVGQDHAQIHRKLLENNVICAHRSGGIRFSPHFYTGQEKINKSLEVLSLII